MQVMQIEFICFLNFDSSTCHSRDIQLLVTEILPVFVTLFVFKKWFKNRYKRVSIISARFAVPPTLR